MPKNLIKKLKIAYKNLYLKSREIGFELSPEQQDIILERVLDEILIKAVSNQVNEGSLTEEDVPEATKMLKEFTIKWKADLDSMNQNGEL